MDTARKSLGHSFGDDSTALMAKNSLVWGAFLIGVVLGFVAVYLVAAQPFFAQFGALQRQMAALEADVQLLVGSRHEAWQTGNLLSDLTALKNQLRDARATVREIRSLRQDLLEESRHTGAAAEALVTLTKLQDLALEQQELTNPASRSLEGLAEIARRLIDESDAAPRAAQTLADLDRVRGDLVELLALKSQLADGTGDLAAATSAAGELLALKDQIVSRGHDAGEAHVSADRLIRLQDELKGQGAGLTDALSNLDRLVEIKDKLADQTPAVADAVQNLDILSDFQHEFGEQIRSLAKMREGLVEVVLMEGALTRVAKVLEPLAQIANVRRLSDRELREAARSILENRSMRISSKPDAPRGVPLESADDPFNNSRNGPGAEHESNEPGPVPPPLALPLSTN